MSKEKTNQRAILIFTLTLCLGLALAFALTNLARAQKAVFSDQLSVDSNTDHRSRHTEPNASSDKCFATPNNGTTEFSSSDADAVQDAVNAATPGSTVKVAGYCAGVQVRVGLTQTVYISKNLTLRGGYTNTNWTVSDPDTYTTTLDALRNGRVAVVTGTITVTLDSLTISGADYDGHAGGIYNDTSTLTITNTRVISNIVRMVISSDEEAGEGGGLGNRGTLFIYNSTFKENWAQEHGGAINNDSGQVTIDNSELSLNIVRDGDGGGLDTGGYNGTAVVTITNSLFTGNKVGDDGGAIWNGNGALLTVSDSHFLLNEAIDKGGALYCTDEGTLRIYNTDIINNVVRDSGGGLYVNWDAHVYASNSTVSGNRVLTSTEILENGGGGIKIDNDGAMTLTHMTVVSNTAPNLSGRDGILVLTGSLTISNSLIAYNGRGLPGAADCRVESVGTMTSSGYNLSSDATCSSLTATGDITNTDPLLAPLADNGGDTETHGLMPGSPALDAIPLGNCVLPTDQRGVMRPQGGACDIGAFEGPPYTLTVATTGTGNGTVTGQGINCSSDCTEIYPHGTVVALTANSDTESTFTGWSGSGCSGTGSCTLTMSQTRSVTATFTLDQHELAVSLEGSGGGSVTSSPAGIDCSTAAGSDCSEPYDQGTVVTLTASADSGSTFGGWTGACTNASGDCVVTMTAAKSVTATFTEVPSPPDEFALTVSLAGTGSGTVTSSPVGIDCSGAAGADCSETYTDGTAVTLTAVPDSGSIFAGWSGACSGSGTCQVIMTEAKSVTATCNKLDVYLPLVSR